MNIRKNITDLSMEQREWYLKTISQFGWPKAEPSKKIANNAHDVIALTMDEQVYNLKRLKT